MKWSNKFVSEKIPMFEGWEEKPREQEAVDSQMRGKDWHEPSNEDRSRKFETIYCIIEYKYSKKWEKEEKKKNNEKKRRNSKKELNNWLILVTIIIYRWIMIKKLTIYINNNDNNNDNDN